MEEDSYFESMETTISDLGNQLRRFHEQRLLIELLDEDDNLSELAKMLWLKRGCRRGR
jgi:hypothetical protein